LEGALAGRDQDPKGGEPEAERRRAAGRRMSPEAVTGQIWEVRRETYQLNRNLHAIADRESFPPPQQHSSDLGLRNEGSVRHRSPVPESTDLPIPSRMETGGAAQPDWRQDSTSYAYGQVARFVN
jgi:hypothetical protein